MTTTDLANWKHMDIECRDCGTVHAISARGGDIPECCPRGDARGFRFYRVQHDGVRIDITNKINWQRP